MTHPPECSICPDRKEFKDYSKFPFPFKSNYCGKLGINPFDNQVILTVDYWTHVNTSPVFCPHKFPRVVEEWRRFES